MNGIMQARATVVAVFAVLTACGGGGGGCMFIKPIRPGLPQGARLTQESGAVLSYTPREAGTIYLRDPADDVILAKLPAWPGQRLDVDAQANVVTFDGRAVTTAAQLRGDRNYQIFFAPAAGGGYVYRPSGS